MILSRRNFLPALAGAAVRPAAAEQSIDRASLVRRHNPVVDSFDPLAPLSVGNGEFAFTADLTGLQTFPKFYEEGIPLCTMSQWGWHTVPNPRGLGPADLRPTLYDSGGRQVPHATAGEGQMELFNWLRENPHRLHLGRVGFLLNKDDAGAVTPAAVQNASQTLDLWTGILTSRFEYEGRAVRVQTCCHPDLDLLAVRVEPAIAVTIEFPYGSPGMKAADWDRQEAHQTEPRERGGRRLDIRRQLDGDSYAVAFAWEGNASVRREGRHRFVLVPKDSDRLSFACCFSPRAIGNLPGVDRCFAASRSGRERFWSRGGAIDLSGSADPRARELERRIVLSQYLTAIQSSGTMPPQETGLTANSWYGKFHLEMHWWHAAHFALWGRTELLERSLPWYQSILPSARQKAKDQGYAGARWPKMCGPDGRDSPSPIGPLLIWQQPHPIAYAELCYRAHPGRTTLERYRDIVFETAEFMASYARWDAERSRYVLGPPVIPAQENHPPLQTWNPAFELEYWAWGLERAIEWRKRLGLAPEPRWKRVRAHLAPLPEKDGVYLAHENCPETYTARNRDHPSMLAAYGVLPGSKVNRETMRRTLRKVLDGWQWPETWGWDYPMVAMTAARLGEPAIAVDALLMDTPKNRYLKNGHNWQRRGLPLYLPGNGGLLAATALMAAGWQGAPAGHAPVFPRTWNVRHEGLNAWL